MKQIRLEQFGPPSQVARCTDVPDPGQPSDWEVVVEVEASTINWADLARMAGRYGDLPRLPGTIGLEGTGTVLACGAAVKNLAVGDKVLLVANDNWSQRRKVAASMVHKLRPETDLVQASGFKVGPPTALHLVRDQVKLPAGSWIVQTAPLSFVGRSVIQVARRDGFRTLNIVRRPEAIDEVLALGGDAAILSTTDDWTQPAREATRGEPIKLALDALGGDNVGRMADLLAPGSLVVVYGILSGKPASLACEHLLFRNISVQGYWLTKILGRMSHQQRNELMSEVERLHVDEGLFRLNVAAEYGLNDIARALREAETVGGAGKVVLRPQR